MHRRRQNDAESGRNALVFLLVVGLLSCSVVFFFLSDSTLTEEHDEGSSSCCRGIDRLELWGEAANWGYDFFVNSSRDCCLACKNMCRPGAACACDSWVFCGDQLACGPRFGECWLKKQKDSFEPDRKDSGDHVMWTSGLVFAPGKDVIGFETVYGVIRIQLFPGCAPLSVAYIVDVLQLRPPSGCRFSRAESRGRSWDSEGNHIENAPFGPPYAFLQGSIEAHGTIFTEIPPEFCPKIRRGSVGWVGSGPEFFISLANHGEWRTKYTVFGSVLPQDMGIVEKISRLPTRVELLKNIHVHALEKPVTLRLTRIGTRHDTL